MRTLGWFDLNRSISCLPKSVHDYLLMSDSDIFLAGGYIRAMVTGEKVNDIDLFCHSKYNSGGIEKIARDIHHRMSDGKDTIEKTQNSWTIVSGDLVVQIITRWQFETPEQCINTFDFTIASAAIWFDKNKDEWSSICHDCFYEDLAAKRLIYTKPPIKVGEEKWSVPGATLLRVLKFYQKGYRIPLDSLAHIVSRLARDVDQTKLQKIEAEDPMAHVITGMLREVDPNLNPDRNAYLPEYKG